jgi:3-hydroxyisobutyrate dehydrogenase
MPHFVLRSLAMSNLQCAFIGLGAMGAPMARHLHAHGLLRAVLNRSADKAQALASELGVRSEQSAEALADCDVVLLCLPADADVLAWVETLASVLTAGSVVIDHSTVAPGTAQQAATLLDSRGIGFLDAPVSGGVEGARNGKLSIMVGGDAEILERARPVLEAYAARITLLGPNGAGQATKAVNQVMVAGINQAVCEALALGEALGLDAERLLPTLGAGAAGNWFLDKRGATLLRSEFTPGFKCAHLLKDLRIVLPMAEALGLHLPTTAQSLADYAALVETGRGELDTSALVTRKRS